MIKRTFSLINYSHAGIQVLFLKKTWYFQFIPTSATTLKIKVRISVPVLEPCPPLFIYFWQCCPKALKMLTVCSTVKGFLWSYSYYLFIYILFLGSFFTGLSTVNTFLWVANIIYVATLATALHKNLQLVQLTMNDTKMFLSEEDQLTFIITTMCGFICSAL